MERKRSERYLVPDPSCSCPCSYTISASPSPCAHLYYLCVTTYISSPGLLRYSLWDPPPSRLLHPCEHLWSLQPCCATGFRPIFIPRIRISRREKTLEIFTQHEDQTQLSIPRVPFQNRCTIPHPFFLLPFPFRFVACTIAVVFSVPLALSFGPHFNTWTVRRETDQDVDWELNRDVDRDVDGGAQMRKQTKAREKYSNEKTRRYDGYAIAGRDGRLPSEATSVAESLPPDEPDPVKHGVSAIAAKLPPPCPSSSSPSLSVFPAQPRVALSVSCHRIPTGGVWRSGLLQARSFTCLGKLCSYRCLLRCIIYFAGKQKKL